MTQPQSKTGSESVPFYMRNAAFTSRGYFMGLTMLFAAATFLAWVEWWVPSMPPAQKPTLFSTWEQHPEQRLPRLAGKPNHIFRLNQMAVLVGDGGMILVSRDNGATWRQQALPEALKTPQYMVQLVRDEFQVVQSSMTFEAVGDSVDKTVSAVVSVSDPNRFPVLNTTVLVKRGGQIIPQPDVQSTRKSKSGKLKMIDSTPELIYFDGPGSYQISVSADGFQGVEQTVVVDPNRLYELTVTAAPMALAPVDPPKTFPNLQTVFFLNEKTGWIGGDHVLLRTTDGGGTWTVQPTSPARLDFKQLWFGDTAYGWGLQHNGTLLFTKDGGASWTAYSESENSEVVFTTLEDGNQVTQMGFLNQQNGWILNPRGLQLIRGTGHPPLPLPDIVDDTGSTYDVVCFDYDRLGHGWALAVGRDSTRWGVAEYRDGHWTAHWGNGPFAARDAVSIQHAFEDVLIVKMKDQLLYRVQLNKEASAMAAWCLTANVDQDGIMLWVGDETVVGKASLYKQDLVFGAAPTELIGSMVPEKIIGRNAEAQNNLSKSQYAELIGAPGALLREKIGPVEDLRFFHRVKSDAGDVFITHDRKGGLFQVTFDEEIGFQEIANLWPEFISAAVFQDTQHGLIGTASGRIYRYPAVTKPGQQVLGAQYSASFLNGFQQVAGFETGAVTSMVYAPGAASAKEQVTAVTSGGWVYQRDLGVDGSWTASHLKMGPLVEVATQPLMEVVNITGEVGQSKDQGQTWSDKPTYLRLPMMIYPVLLPGYLLFALVYIYGYLRRRRDLLQPRQADDPNQDFVDAVFDNDQPIHDGRFDKLGFNNLAKGIVDFLANQKTIPPLTLAVTGSWGTGKSSLMNLIGGLFKNRGFPVVYFNAWHHHKERHLLAALLERIRVDGVPDLLNPNRIRFRWNLFWTRTQSAKMWTVLLVFVLSGWITFLVQVEHYHDLYPPNVVLAWKKSITTRVLNIQSIFDPKDEVAEKRLEQDNDDAPGLLPFLSTLLFLAIYLRKTLTTFGIKPSKLIEMTGSSMNVKTLNEGIGFRKKFADEFNDFTKALGEKQLVIIIDDVDRCMPEQVMEVMEALNFLSSCGPCYLILGIDKDKVEKCIGWAYREIAVDFYSASEAQRDEHNHEPAESQPAAEAIARACRMRLAREYLEKLINIEVPIPHGDELQIEAFLKPHASVAEASSQDEDSSSRLKRFLLRPAVLNTAVLALVVLLGVLTTQNLISPPDITALSTTALEETTDDQTPPPQQVREPVADTLVKTNAAKPDSGSQPENPASNNAPLQVQRRGDGADQVQQDLSPLNAAAPEVGSNPMAGITYNANHPGLLVPAGPHSRLPQVMFGFALLLLFGAFPFFRSLPKPELVQVEAALQAAISLWAPFFVSKQISPRLVKRVVNKVRFFHNISQAKGLELPIEALAALAVIDHCYHEEGVAGLVLFDNWGDFWHGIDPHESAFEPIEFSVLCLALDRLKTIFPDLTSGFDQLKRHHQ